MNVTVISAACFGAASAAAQSYAPPRKTFATGACATATAKVSITCWSVDGVLRVCVTNTLGPVASLLNFLASRVLSPLRHRVHFIAWPFHARITSTHTRQECMCRACVRACCIVYMLERAYIIIGNCADARARTVRAYIQWIMRHSIRVGRTDDNCDFRLRVGVCLCVDSATYLPPIVYSETSTLMNDTSAVNCGIVGGMRTIIFLHVASSNDSGRF